MAAWIGDIHNSVVVPFAKAEATYQRESEELEDERGEEVEQEQVTGEAQNEGEAKAR